MLFSFCLDLSSRRFFKTFKIQFSRLFFYFTFQPYTSPWNIFFKKHWIFLILFRADCKNNWHILTDGIRIHIIQVDVPVSLSPSIILSLYPSPSPIFSLSLSFSLFLFPSLSLTLCLYPSLVLSFSPTYYIPTLGSCIEFVISEVYGGLASNKPSLRV